MSSRLPRCPSRRQLQHNSLDSSTLIFGHIPADTDTPLAPRFQERLLRPQLRDGAASRGANGLPDPGSLGFMHCQSPPTLDPSTSKPQLVWVMIPRLDRHTTRVGSDLGSRQAMHFPYVGLRLLVDPPR
ncbi:hypothetical protein G7Z17_g10349 [Cylindrodendrum hubeiense]|uniref:Uncharacterized protein n=1 Tax=Cylindrodendrum hubeiense TaxID=595255 RepID=A0A9P5LCR5_9HYPO|nr:hypothetical protein G7Z17_g10349 [Cylindrodendrum hubeiense]